MTHLAKPAITILMTVFNAEAYLASSIESIQRQTFSDWEFIIVDDASTDSSLAITESYAAKDPRIKIIRNAINKGQTRCLNQGLAEARADLIARQDADDLSHLQRLEKQWQRFQQEPTLALLGTCGVIINQKNDLIGILDKPLIHEVISWSAAITNPFLHTSVMFRADVVRVLGGYDEHYQIAQDYELWTRIMRRYNVANLPERLISYRHLESSLSKAGKNKAFQEANRVATREEKNSFGRDLQPQEHSLIKAFREGEIVNQKKLFQLFKTLQLSFSVASKEIIAHQKHLEAMLHLQSAGAHRQCGIAQVNEVIAAFFIAPLYTMRWVGKRFFSRFCSIGIKLF